MLAMFGVGAGGAAAFFFLPWRQWTASSAAATGSAIPDADERVPVPAGPVRMSVPPALATAANAARGTTIDPTSLPAPDNRAKLVGAARLQPDGLALPEGVSVTWPLAYKRWPGSPLFIASWDPAQKKWIGSGEEAVVADNGIEATGLVRHFSDHGLVDRRVGGYSYETEWVFMLAAYERDLDRLAKDLSNATRTSLGLPGGVNLTTQQWLAPGPLTIGDKTIDAACLAAASAFFASRKKRLDDAFAGVFESWSAVTRAGDATSVIAQWEAIRDLRHLGDERGTNWKATVAVWAREQARDEIVDKSIDLLKKGVEKYAGKAPPDFLVEPAKKKLKTSVDEGFTKLFGNPAQAECTDVADTFAEIADRQLFDLIYAVKPGTVYGPTAPGLDPQFNTDFHSLSGPETRRFGFKTTLGVEFAKEDYFDRMAMSLTWEVGDGIPRVLHDAELEGLKEGVATIPGTGFVSTKDPKRAGNFLQIQEKHRAWKRTYEAEAANTVKYWFDLQARAQAPTATDRDKLLALGAIRLLRADLHRYVTKESLSRYVKDYATKQLVKKLAKLAPLGALGPIASAWEELFKKAVESGTDAIAPDLLVAFVKELQAASERAAARVNIDSKLPVRFPQGELGMLELLDVGKIRLPPGSCGDAPVPTNLGCDTGKPSSWSVLQARSSVSPTYIMCNACGPSGAGAAVNLEIGCPAQTAAAWQSKTGGTRRSEVGRTATTVRTREQRSITGFCGTGSVGEKLFVKLDDRAVATIYVIKNEGGPNPDSLTDWARAMANASPAHTSPCP